jgi:signal transduction histidine kinase
MASLLDNATSHGDGDVHVSVAGDAGRAQVRVRDEGEGVPAPMRGLVFERRVSGGRGTGIGLALAASLAAAESGTLELSDRDSAEFVLTLPLVHGESVATPDQASTDTSR